MLNKKKLWTTLFLCIIKRNDVGVKIFNEKSWSAVARALVRKNDWRKFVRRVLFYLCIKHRKRQIFRCVFFSFFFALRAKTTTCPKYNRIITYLIRMFAGYVAIGLPHIVWAFLSVPIVFVTFSLLLLLLLLCSVINSKMRIFYINASEVEVG